VHLRLPSFDRGVTAFFWSFVLAFYAWVFMLAIGVHKATALVIALLCLFFFFLFVRLFGGDEKTDA
jgi:hypothetical protein